MRFGGWRAAAACRGRAPAPEWRRWFRSSASPEVCVWRGRWLAHVVPAGGAASHSRECAEQPADVAPGPSGLNAARAGRLPVAAGMIAAGLALARRAAATAPGAVPPVRGGRMCSQPDERRALPARPGSACHRARRKAAPGGILATHAIGDQCLQSSRYLYGPLSDLRADYLVSVLRRFGIVFVLVTSDVLRHDAAGAMKVPLVGSAAPVAGRGRGRYAI